MSMESAKAFVEKINTDPDFAKKVAGCKDPKERMTFAKKEGFDFTADEVKSLSKELSDDALASLSGGWGCSMDSCSTFRPYDVQPCTSDQ